MQRTEAQARSMKGVLFQDRCLFMDRSHLTTGKQTEHLTCSYSQGPTQNRREHLRHLLSPKSNHQHPGPSPHPSQRSLVKHNTASSWLHEGRQWGGELVASRVSALMLAAGVWEVGVSSQTSCGSKGDAREEKAVAQKECNSSKKAI